MFGDCRPGSRQAGNNGLKFRNREFVYSLRHLFLLTHNKPRPSIDKITRHIVLSKKSAWSLLRLTVTWQTAKATVPVKQSVRQTKIIEGTQRVFCHLSGIACLTTRYSVSPQNTALGIFWNIRNRFITLNQWKLVLLFSKIYIFF